ncbi:hypothetical protein BV898_02052 [Hypsibius exemplaris]|uniref:Uncharacterized protein n=1 Tax=Hypsibius exemplaris TaxID=2072580 RepID=A0A1W0X984_HYPEX|nr:hypothetical protein BV898_02052 [Hypsibius exemplaris]
MLQPTADTWNSVSSCGIPLLCPLCTTTSAALLLGWTIHNSHRGTLFPRLRCCTDSCVCIPFSPQRRALLYTICGLLWTFPKRYPRELQRGANKHGACSGRYSDFVNGGGTRHGGLFGRYTATSSTREETRHRCLFAGGTRDFDEEEQGTGACSGAVHATSSTRRETRRRCLFGAVTREFGSPRRTKDPWPVPGRLLDDFVNEDGQGHGGLSGFGGRWRSVLTVPDFIDIPPAAVPQAPSGIWISNGGMRKSTTIHGKPVKGHYRLDRGNGSVAGCRYDAEDRRDYFAGSRGPAVVGRCCSRVYDVLPSRKTTWRLEQLPTKLHHLRRFAERLGYAGMTELEVDILGHRKKRGIDDDEATRDVGDGCTTFQTGQVYHLDFWLGCAPKGLRYRFNPCFYHVADFAGRIYRAYEHKVTNKAVKEAVTVYWL